MAAGIVIAGWLLYRGVVHFKDSDRVVSVKGLSEKEVKADRAIWPLVYKLAGNDLGSLYNTIESTNAKIVSFLLFFLHLLRLMPFLNVLLLFHNIHHLSI